MAITWVLLVLPIHCASVIPYFPRDLVNASEYIVDGSDTRVLRNCHASAEQRCDHSGPDYCSDPKTTFPKKPSCTDTPCGRGCDCRPGQGGVCSTVFCSKDGTKAIEVDYSRDYKPDPTCQHLNDLIPVGDLWVNSVCENNGPDTCHPFCAENTSRVTDRCEQCGSLVTEASCKSTTSPHPMMAPPSMCCTWHAALDKVEKDFHSILVVTPDKEASIVV